MEPQIRIKSKQTLNGDLSKHLPNNLKKCYSKSISKFKQDQVKYRKTLRDQNKTKHDLLRHISKDNPLKLKLPRRYEDICANQELCKILLKDIKEMTQEEQNFINSFNKQEHKIFLNFLKRQAQEYGWQGNGMGTGYYLNNLIHFYRERERVFY